MRLTGCQRTLSTGVHPHFCTQTTDAKDGPASPNIREAQYRSHASCGYIGISSYFKGSSRLGTRVSLSLLAFHSGFTFGSSCFLIKQCCAYLEMFNCQPYLLGIPALISKLFYYLDAIFRISEKQTRTIPRPHPCFFMRVPVDAC